VVLPGPIGHKITIFAVCLTRTELPFDVGFCDLKTHKKFCR